jgi:hypothetical protein
MSIRSKILPAKPVVRIEKGMAARLVFDRKKTYKRRTMANTSTVVLTLIFSICRKSPRSEGANRAFQWAML